MSKMREAFEKQYKIKWDECELYHIKHDFSAGYQAAIAAVKEGGAAVWVRYSVGRDPSFAPVINGAVTFKCSATEALEYEPLYKLPEDAP